MVKFFLAAVAALSLAAPVAAFAQDAPSYAQAPDPSDANGGDENIHGRVLTFDGGYSLEVRDDRGFIDNVELHDGTIINPTGLTLAPGMVVSILGYNSGSFFAANEIDTPYTLENDVAWYSGEPWYDYGPSYSLDFFFGNAGWWHRSFFGGDRGGFRGRIFVAPPERGGYYPHQGDHGGNFSGGYHGGYHGGNSNSGDRGTNFNGGYHGNNVNAGYRGTNVTGGYRGTNFTGGYRGTNVTGGYRGTNFGGGYRGGNTNSGGHGGNFSGAYHGGNSNGGGYHGGDAGGGSRRH
jgi:hypothetical protein